MSDQADTTKIEITPDIVTGFLTVDMQTAELTPGKPFPGFAVGEFTDMMGREIKFPADKIKSYLQNTIDAIKAYQGKGMPGLPIDDEKHSKGKAAGWIVGVELTEVTDSTGKKIPGLSFLAEWTSLGVQLIKDKVLVNFSPSFDRVDEKIVGGSLTNWPASVDKKGVPLFPAVELAQGILRSADMSKPKTEPAVEAGIDLETAVTDPATVDPQPEQAGNGDESMTVNLSELSEEQKKQLLEQARKTVLSELTPNDGGTADEAVERLRKELNMSAFADVADLSKAREALLGQAKQALESEYRRMQNSMGSMLADMMKGIKTEQHIAELSQKWTGGTEKHPHGFPVGREEMEAFLGSLNDSQRTGAESILGRIFENGLVEFSELGHGRRVEQRHPVPDDIAPLLKEALDRGATPAEFFAAAGLGSADNYDLSAFEGGK